MKLLLFLSSLVLKEGHRWGLVGVLVWVQQGSSLVGLHLGGRSAGLPREIVIDLHLLQALADLLDLGGWLWRVVPFAQCHLLLLVLQELGGGGRTVQG